ncbi:hypothetical protein [Lysobacter sp. Root983]|nr:hypothetical protein [Lysobacter sp. Root983]
MDLQKIELKTQAPRMAGGVESSQRLASAVVSARFQVFYKACARMA